MTCLSAVHITEDTKKMTVPYISVLHKTPGRGNPPRHFFINRGIKKRTNAATAILPRPR